ncbi:MAG: hypothetical protein ACRC52_12005, partial [Aeromonas veronii]
MSKIATSAMTSYSTDETGVASLLGKAGDKVVSLWRSKHANVDPFKSLMLVSVSDGYTRAQVATVPVETSMLQAGDWEALLPALEQAVVRLQRKFDYP